MPAYIRAQRGRSLLRLLLLPPQEPGVRVGSDGEDLPERPRMRGMRGSVSLSSSDDEVEGAPCSDCAAAA